jgi:hypothetical protein
MMMAVQAIVGALAPVLTSNFGERTNGGTNEENKDDGSK